jgi:hypothetical protein
VFLTFQEQTFRSMGLENMNPSHDLHLRITGHLLLISQACTVCLREMGLGRAGVVSHLDSDSMWQ